MADDVTVTDAPTAIDAPVEDAATAPEQDTPPDLGDAGKKAIDRMKAERDEARKEAKANAEAAKRLAELEDAQKTESERLAARAQAAEERAAKAEADAARQLAALKHKLDADDLDLLKYIPADEVEEYAARLAARKPRPVGDIDQGRRGNGTAGPSQLTRADLAGMSPSAIEEARVAGRLADLMSGK